MLPRALVKAAVGRWMLRNGTFPTEVVQVCRPLWPTSSAVGERPESMLEMLCFVAPPCSETRAEPPSPQLRLTSSSRFLIWGNRKLLVRLGYGKGGFALVCRQRGPAKQGVLGFLG